MRVLTIVAATPARAASSPSKKPAKSTTRKLEQSCPCRHRSKYLDSHLPISKYSFDLQHGNSRRWNPFPRTRPPLPRLLRCRDTRKSSPTSQELTRRPQAEIIPPSSLSATSLKKIRCTKIRSSATSSSSTASPKSTRKKRKSGPCETNNSNRSLRQTPLSRENHHRNATRYSDSCALGLRTSITRLL